MGTHATKTDARKALQANGYVVPKGTEVQVTELGSKVYAVELEQFMAIATEVSAAEVEQD